MKEPRRLREESRNTLERSLLAAGMAYRSSPETRARTLASLGLVSLGLGSAGTSSGAAATAVNSGTNAIGTAWTLAQWGWGKLVLAVSAVGAVATLPAGIWAFGGDAAEEARIPDNVVLLAPATHRSVPDQPLRSEVLAVPQDSLVTAESTGPSAPAANKPSDEPTSRLGAGQRGPAGAPSNKPVSGFPRTTGVPADTKVPGLTAELGALDAARLALGQGDAVGSLARLDAYSRSYPRGRLVLEAEVLRIHALQKTGQTGLAKKRAQAFLQRHPNSVLASRVRSLLEE